MVGAVPLLVPFLGGFGTTTYLIQGKTLVLRGDPWLPLSNYEVEVDADSSYDERDGIRAISWEMRDRGSFAARQTWGDRLGEGPNHTELLAALHGLHSARLYEAESVHLRIDNKLAAGIISELWTARQRNIAKLAVRVPFILKGFDMVAMTWVRSEEIKGVDTAAKRIRNRLRNSRSRWLREWASNGVDRTESIKWRTGPRARVGFYRQEMRRP
jgi:ribonuclease HI